MIFMGGKKVANKDTKDVVWSYVASMRVGIVLLIIIATLSILGTVIPQGEAEGIYYQEYSETVADIILATGMDDVFEAWWYLLIAGLLCINIMACSINRLPGIYRSVFKPRKKLKEKGIKNLLNNDEVKFNSGVNDSKEKIEETLNKEGYKTEIVEGDGDNGSTIIFANKGKFGYFGSFITHISFLIIILGFMYGNLTGFDTSIGGIPGDKLSREYMDFDLKIEDFEIDYRDDYSVDQYYSTLTVYENGEEMKNETIYVNRPLRYDGINFYQSSYGWEGKLRIDDEDNFFLDTIGMYEGMEYTYPHRNMLIHLRAFYPDFDYDEDGHPINRSPYPRNPKFVWTIHQGGEFVDMIVSEKGETFEYEGAEFTFTDYEQYTVFRVVKDPSIPIFYFGSGLMMLGLILSFFMSPRRIWAVIKPEGENESRLVIGGQSFKGKELFKDDFRELVDNIKGTRGDK